MAGLYIHIPFCKQACYYCDFHFSTLLREKSNLLEGIKMEAKLIKNPLDYRFETLYFGGGTPSLLSIDEFKDLLTSLKSTFDLSNLKEMTLEANPDDLSPSFLKDLKSIGFNRLSIGIQSFHDEVLTNINRAHNSRQATQCIQDAKAAGFNNLSLDLIYGLPGSSFEILQEDLRKIVEINPNHVSIYALTIEENTVFGRRKKKGLLNSPEEEEEFRQFNYIMETLQEADYIQYEISNFGKKGSFSQHNNSYWKSTPYLGLGPSAHSFDGENRWHNLPNNSLYLKEIAKGLLPRQMEERTANDRLNEYIFTSLRTLDGMNMELILQNFGVDIKGIYPSKIALLSKEGIIEQRNNHLVLTQKGKCLADQIASDFFLVED